MRGENGALQLIRPKNRFQTLVYAPLHSVPMYPECEEAQIIFEELLGEEKSS
jgi:hypothetical protein